MPRAKLPTAQCARGFEPHSWHSYISQDARVV